MSASDDEVDEIDDDMMPTLHSDPFVLGADRCNCPTCEFHTAKPIRLYPCLSCFGRYSYCSEECMDDDYPDHTLECSRAKRKVIKSTVPMITRRRKQLTSAGFTKLLRYVIKNTTKDTLLDNLFWIRLPWQTGVHLTQDHTVKKVGRTEIAGMIKSTIVLKEAYRVWLGHLAANPHPHIYFFTYPPDMSFVFMTAMRWDDEEIVDPESTPSIELITCPCAIHKGRAVEERQEAAELSAAAAGGAAEAPSALAVAAGTAT